MDKAALALNKAHKSIPILVAAAVSATALLAPPKAHAQKCTGNINVGCLHPGAACSPVTIGLGPSGHCKTPAGLPPGERECECTGKPAPTLDSKCSDRTATGKIECTVNQPAVNRHETPYPTVVFAPGDIVEVRADGCVQTGGVGDTWKRYVNPTGPRSAGLYHGLIRLPTAKPAGSGLVPINTVITKRQTITGTGLPVSQLFLHLGYEDDDYSDNGYYGHDDGTEDQCKMDPSQAQDGGPAHVTITIYRGVSPDTPPETRFDFDVVSTTTDPNGLPYNPLWSWQTRLEHKGQIPDTSQCHNFSRRGSTLDVPDEYMSPYFADCTDQADMSTVDQPIGTNGTLCRLRTVPYLGDTFAGHVNWFPVTVEGNAGWGDHSGWPYPFGDDDYTFTYTSDGQDNPLSVNGRSGLHVEFDSDETIDSFTSDEWSALRDAVNNNNEQAKQRFDGHTILTGMFGLDTEHMKAELHPLYALATRRDTFGFETDPKDEVWLMFVRNQGDEGYCSSQNWDAGFEDYTFRLPWRPGMTSVDVNWDKTQFVGPDGTSGPSAAVLLPPSKDAGVYVTFHLGPAVHNSYIFSPGASVPFINGALHLVWTGPPVVHPVAPPGGSVAERGAAGSGVSGRPPAATAGGGLASPVEADEVEHLIRAAINQLPAAQRPQVEKARILAGTQTVAVHRLSSTRLVRRITQPPPVARIARLHAIKAGPATRKLARDMAQMRALCAASHNAPAGLPASVCTGNVRDHR